MIALLALAACDWLAPEPVIDDTASEPLSETTEPVEAEVMGVLAACTSEGAWNYEAWTDGPVTSATIDTFALRGVDGWNESHALPIVSSSGLGASLFLSLEAGVARDEHQPGINTPLVCGVDDRSDDMAYVLRVYDDSGRLLDCVSWGPTAYAVLDDPLGRKGDVPAVNPVDQAEEISRSACRVLG